jgi:hypothetical protein
MTSPEWNEDSAHEALEEQRAANDGRLGDPDEVGALINNTGDDGDAATG